MIAYLDTSAILRLFLQEEGSDVVAGLWDAADARVTSRLAYPEARAAMASAFRAGRLTRQGHLAAKRELDRRWRQFLVMEVTAAVAQRAGDLAESHGLRGYDAVHLASAEQAASATAVLVTWDRDLASAARTLGLGVAPSLVRPPG